MRPSVEPITTLDALREHLQWALELEHCTMPPYLCALYSLLPGRNTEAAQVIRSVLLEEMLHLGLVANLLNALGGRPRFDARRMMLGYPRRLPHGALEITLQRFGPEALDLFLQIERPALADAPAESDRYETIGQFYAAIEGGLRTLSEQLGERALFGGAPERQVGPQYFYGAGGRLLVVQDLDTALRALAEIVEQGEGAAHRDVWDGDRDLDHPGRAQVAHYFRFEQLRAGRRYRAGDSPASGPTGEPLAVDWTAVRPMRANPRPSDHAPGSPIRLAQDAFAGSYAGLLSGLDRAFDGTPTALRAATGLMLGLQEQAEALMAMPCGDGTTAGPAFAYPSE
ncbi:MAG: ferritin-like protein [Polyangiales bacterium]